MNRTLLAALALSAVAGSGGVAVAATHSDRSTPQPVTRVTHFYPTGPSASYESDVGSVGEVGSTEVTVPTGGEYDAVLALSLEYSTRGPGPFYVTVRVADPGHRASGTVVPVRARLAPSAERTTTTVRFLARGLQPGSTYLVTPSVNSRLVAETRNAIGTGRVLMTVDLTAD